MACSDSFPSCREKNDPDPKSGWDLDPDKPVWSTSCQEDVTVPSFLCVFPQFHDFCNRQWSYCIGSSGTLKMI